MAWLVVRLALELAQTRLQSPWCKYRPTLAVVCSLPYPISWTQKNAQRASSGVRCPTDIQGSFGCTSRIPNLIQIAHCSWKRTSYARTFAPGKKVSLVAYNAAYCLMLTGVPSALSLQRETGSNQSALTTLGQNQFQAAQFWLNIITRWLGWAESLLKLDPVLHSKWWERTMKASGRVDERLSWFFASNLHQVTLHVWSQDSSRPQAATLRGDEDCTWEPS